MKASLVYSIISKSRITKVISKASEDKRLLHKTLTIFYIMFTDLKYIKVNLIIKNFLYVSECIFKKIPIRLSKQKDKK